NPFRPIRSHCLPISVLHTCSTCHRYGILFPILRQCLGGMNSTHPPSPPPPSPFRASMGPHHTSLPPSLPPSSFLSLRRGAFCPSSSKHPTASPILAGGALALLPHNVHLVAPLDELIGCEGRDGLGLLHVRARNELPLLQLPRMLEQLVLQRVVD